MLFTAICNSLNFMLLEGLACHSDNVIYDGIVWNEERNLKLANNFYIEKMIIG